MDGVYCGDDRGSGDQPACAGAETSSGEIEKVDTSTQTVIVAAECECGSGKIIEMTFTLNQKTQLLLDGKAAKIADLKKGDRVEIDYEDTDQVTKISATR